MKRRTTPHYEIVPARLYYGSHARWSVLLRNGVVVHHGPKKEIHQILRNLKKGLI